MPTNLRLSYLFLRLGLAAVFIWFGIDKFVHPSYWVNAWVPLYFLAILAKIHIASQSFIYLCGIFEVLVSISLITEIFIKTFSVLAAIFLVATLFSVGISEVTIRDFSIVGSLLAIVFWSSRSHRFS